MRFAFATILVSTSLGLVACGGGGGTDGGTPDAGTPDTGTPDLGAPDAPTVCGSDTACSDGVFCNGVELCHPASAEADVHGCVRGTSPCLATQTCSESMSMCVTDCAMTGDADGDGHLAASCGGDDCDDADPHRFPGNPELCDERDQDCDPTTFGTLDGDRDGYVSATCCDPSGTSRTCGTDCDDFAADVHPTATEACDGFDNDCNGMVDEGVSVSVYPDADRDGYGDVGSTAVMRCAGAVGYASAAGDCAPMDVSVHPGAPEICDGKDNDCNGMVDDGTTAVVWYADTDGDGYGSARSGTQSSCEPLAGFSLLGTDCNDHAHGISPAANEVCNGIDDDCNGLADFRIGVNDFEDDDGDLHPDAHCTPAGDDCDDDDANVHPGAPEICDLKDDDCNGVSDDGTMSASWLADADGDGYGDDASPPTASCTQPPGRVQRGGDCDDSDASRHPGAVDVCNGHDDNCNALVDEDAPQTAYWPASADADHDGVASSTVMPTLTCMMPPGSAVRAGGDCDDTNPLVGPQRSEVCNGSDDDCNGMVDDGIADLTCMAGSGATACMRTVPGCNAGVAASCSALPPVLDVCNGRDDDCDGLVDELPDATRSCTAPHAIPACTSGTCHVVACTGTYSDCNHVASDGCEQDLDTSTIACGACGRGCPGGDTCVRGRCSSEVVTLVAGAHFTCALMGAGTVYCWGANSEGQLGADLAATTSSSAVQVVLDPGTGTVAPMTDAVLLAAGDEFACAARTGGSIVCWGRNTELELGTGVATPGLSRHAIVASAYGLPPPVALVATNQVQAAVQSTGDVYFIGTQNTSEFADGFTGGGITTYEHFPTAGHVLVARELHCGYGACAGLDGVTASWWVWGDNTDYKIVGAGGTYAAAASTSYLADASKVAIGGDFSCHVAASSTQVYCEGENNRGQLGRGTPSPVTSQFTDLVALPGTGGGGLAAGLEHACRITDTGLVECWGLNDHGQLGIGSTADAATPTAVAVPGIDATSNRATLIVAGQQHTCVALTDGNVYCWGTNLLGEAGDGTTVERHAPVSPVAGLP